MVSSTVYQIEPMLDQIFAMLTAFGYDVWMSHKGTIPLNPDLNNFENCLIAVERCDIFFGIITTAYGTGVEQKGEQSITHRELLKAIELDKPRFMVCHKNVYSARALLNTLSSGGKSLKGAEGRSVLTLDSKSVLHDLKCIDMLEAANREDVKELADRTNNWTQPFDSEADVLRFVTTQFDPEGNNVELLRRIQETKEVADHASAPAVAKALTAEKGQAS
ncbi:DUF4062 domain-containing protein [Asticcacaulis taihuensis]|nr:DUF4062 domain-containing protein [Asticcacaulis taihuensis]